MVEFLRKFENRALKLLELTRILSPNLLIYHYLLYFCAVFGSILMEGDHVLIEKSMLQYIVVIDALVAAWERQDL